MTKTPFRKIDGKEIRWTDATGVVHIVEGADVHSDVRLLWTLCLRDVPANTVWLLEPGDAHEVCAICQQRASLPPEASNAADSIPRPSSAAMGAAPPEPAAVPQSGGRPLSSKENGV